MVTEVIATFSRKPVFGYKGMIFATLSIAGLSMGVWAHHMYTTGAVLRNPLPIDLGPDRHQVLQLDRHNVPGLSALRYTDPLCPGLFGVLPGRGLHW
jgi:hypothetical protein